MKCIVNGTILLPDGEVRGKALAFEGGKIADVLDAPPEGAETIDAEGGYVSPGLVDVHIHGFMGMDASNGSFGELKEMSRRLAAWGVTAWLPTTMTLKWPALEACFAAIRRAQADSRAGEWGGAQVLGCHAEGPFINPAKKGAQDGTAIQRPDIEKLRPWTDVVKLMTVAPEVDGALPFIREAAAPLLAEGIRLPFVWNSSGYESVETLEAYADLCDTALFDLRYSRDETARAASACAAVAAVWP
ncbi:MAG: amidohydrolase family protein, partial [Clostridia bacterium]|nr:amidohydrolase family protein [Clostridia bacterium]